MVRSDGLLTKTPVSVCLVALVFCLGLVWWVRTDEPVVDGRADAVRNNEMSPAVAANGAIARGWQTPPNWVPSDAERVDDRGASLTWIPSDAERDDDQGAIPGLQRSGSLAPDALSG
jgi:zona occludens toxin (predicted ATPase)